MKAPAHNHHTTSGKSINLYIGKVLPLSHKQVGMMKTSQVSGKKARKTLSSLALLLFILAILAFSILNIVLFLTSKSPLSSSSEAARGPSSQSPLPNPPQGQVGIILLPPEASEASP